MILARGFLALIQSSLASTSIRALKNDVEYAL